MRTLAVTGGIGSGKSLACRFLAEGGIPVYEADSRTKALYRGDLLSRIEEALGGSFSRDGAVDFTALGRTVFSAPEALLRLEEIVHPAVREDFLEWRAGLDASPLVAIESAIILEKPLFDGLYDTVALVYAPRELCLSRVEERNPSLGREEILRRMEAQRPELEKADYLLINDASEEALRAQVAALIANLLKNV